VPDVAFLDQLLDRSGNVLDRHPRVHPVLVEQVDGLDPEALERALHALLDLLGPAVDNLLPAGVDRDPELGGNHDVRANGSEALSQQLFICERPIGLGGVEERDAAFDGRPKQRDHLPPVGGRAIAVAHSHAAKPDGRDLQVAVSKRSLLHRVPFQERGTSFSVAARASGLVMRSMVLAAYRWYLLR
jgi:hypothetical protein